MDKNKIYKYLSGELSDEDGIELRKWVESSEENKRIFQQERKLFDIMNLQTDDVFVNASAQKFLLNQGWVKISLQVAATILLMFVSALTYHAIRTSSDSQYTMQTLTVPSGQQVNLKLADGTMVYLNSNTTIQYPTIFSKDKRTIELIGEAYFEVTHENDRPFIVKTRYGEVEVLGTKFNVEAYTGDSFITTLMDGKVRVNRGNDSYLLAPSEKLSFVKGSMELTHINDFSEYRWRDGLICFKDVPFDQIMTKLSRAYGVNIHINNKNILKQRYSGTFRRSDGIQYALHILQIDTPFELEQDADGSILYIK